MTVAGCGPTGADTSAEQDLAALAYQAQQAGVAIDIWYTSQPPERSGLPDELTPAVFADAGIMLDEGVQVADYVTVRTGRTSTLDDLWQFCLTDAEDNWVSYGEQTAVQDFGNAEGAPVRSPGDHTQPLPLLMSVAWSCRSRTQ